MSLLKTLAIILAICSLALSAKPNPMPDQAGGLPVDLAECRATNAALRAAIEAGDAALQAQLEVNAELMATIAEQAEAIQEGDAALQAQLDVNEELMAANVALQAQLETCNTAGM